MLLLLQILPEAGGAWLLTLGRLGAQAAVGRWEADRVRALLQQVEAALGPDAWPVLGVEGEDAELTEAEDRVGRLLGEALSASPPLGRALAQAQGAAEASGQPLRLLVDAQETAARALPWECLALYEGAVPLERGGTGLLARLSAAVRTPGQGRLLPAIWCADPEDPGVERLSAQVRRVCAQAGLDPVQDATDPAPGAEPLLLFLIGHGESVDQRLHLSGQDGSVAPGTVAHSLLPALGRTVLAVLLICEGGHRPPGRPDGLVDRLLLAGAAAVLASEARLAEDTAVAFLDGLVPALLGGEPLLASVGAGRRAVAARAWPWPESRWWRLSLTVGQASTLDWRLPAAPLLPGWQGDAEVMALLHAALHQAQRRGQGWLGVEHLALSVDLHRLRDPRLRHLLRLHQAELALLCDRFLAASAPAGALSPRLAAVRQRLPPGFGLDDLVRELVASAPRALASLLGLSELPAGDLFSIGGADDESATREDLGRAPISDQPPAGFEVLGGPEDGRRFVLDSGQVLGRASEGGHAAVALYKEVGGVDEFLSRAHLQAQGDGRYLLLRPADHLLGLERVQRPSGPIEVRAGQVLGLTRATVLLALGEV